MHGKPSVRIGVFAAMLAGTMLAATTLSSREAHAAELVVAGPRSCSREAELRARIEQTIGRSLAEAPALRCNVQVVRDGGSYAARLELSTAQAAPSRQRAFLGKTCSKLMDTLQLAVVLALGASSANASPPSSSLAAPPAPRVAPALPRAHPSLTAARPASTRNARRFGNGSPAPAPRRPLLVVPPPVLVVR